MQLQNKSRIAYLGALTLLFSYAEMLLPRFIPFFRLGLGNICILLALGLPLPDFLILTLIKSVASSMLSGTLISPFFLISVSQSILSGLLMWILFKIKKNWLGIYGISLAGSALSGFIQIGISSLYLGKETFSLLGPMLIFSIFSGIITAFLSLILKIPEETPLLKETSKSSNPKLMIFFAIFILLIIIFSFMINNLILLGIILILSVILQICLKRRFMILPHISMWTFVIIISLFSPQGIVLFKSGFIVITKDALLIGIEKSIKLSIAACLSQCIATIPVSDSTLPGLSLAYFRQLLSEYKNQKGSFIKKIQAVLK